MKMLAALLVLISLRAHACGTPARHVAESDDIYFVRTHEWQAYDGGASHVMDVLLTLKGRPILSTIHGADPFARNEDLLTGGKLAVLFRGRK